MADYHPTYRVRQPGDNRAVFILDPNIRQVDEDEELAGAKRWFGHSMLVLI